MEFQTPKHKKIFKEKKNTTQTNQITHKVLRSEWQICQQQFWKQKTMEDCLQNSGGKLFAMSNSLLRQTTNQVVCLEGNL